MARRFSWEDAAARLEKVYASVIGAREHDDAAAAHGPAGTKRSLG